ncbi:hypothetical protein FB451DRAFT_1176741 [Mycena latifolia]|nr:hypothetical protein FB451DRAFT_1176741 [Mycena latifolia]
MFNKRGMSFGKNTMVRRADAGMRSARPRRKNAECWIEMWMAKKGRRCGYQARREREGRGSASVRQRASTTDRREWRQGRGERRGQTRRGRRTKDRWREGKKHEENSPEFSGLKQPIRRKICTCQAQGERWRGDWGPRIRPSTRRRKIQGRPSRWWRRRTLWSNKETASVRTPVLGRRRREPRAREELLRLHMPFPNAWGLVVGFNSTIFCACSSSAARMAATTMRARWELSSFAFENGAVGDATYALFWG